MDKVHDPHLRHLFEEDSLLNIYEENVRNLSVGAPGSDLLKYCIEIMKKSTRHRLDEEEKDEKYYLFQYGITAGLWEFREELAKFLSRRYGDPVKREDLILTCGASQGLQILLNTILSPNGVIFIEEVTYMVAIDVFKQFPLLKIITVPMKDDVVDLNKFEKIVAEEGKNAKCFMNNEKIFWSFFYTIPTFHNPTGMSLPPDKCKRLVEIARENSLMIVCDDVYNLLSYDTKFPPHRLFFYDDPKDSDYKGGNVISNGSFSKILFPAIRIGWMECAPRIANIIKASGIMCSSGGANNYLSGIVASILHQGLQDEHLDRLTETYKERLSALCETLNRHLPSCCSYNRPTGGYFVWIHLPSGVNAMDFVKWCQQQYKVSALPGIKFSYTGNCINFLRISISFHKKETLVSAATTLCTALLEYIRNRTEHETISIGLT